MKLGKSLSIATLAAISFAAVEAIPTQAATIKYKFTANVTSGSNPGEYLGSFQYDDSFLTGLGLETLGIEDGLKVTFNYLGETFTEEDDADFDAYPIVSFDDGKILGLNYFVADKFTIAGDLDTPDVGGNIFYVIDESVNATAVGTVTYSRVPEPLAIGGTAIAATAGLFIKRKKKVTKTTLVG
ncbi:PEP-CTERM sorting domain-containing protein [Nostoc sp. NIES-2111]